jgi:hypothetical protein
LCLEYSGRWTKFKMAVYFITIHDHQEHWDMFNVKV